jgi:preprotein translocase subunit SecG
MLPFLREQGDEMIPVSRSTDPKLRPEGADIGTSTESQTQEFFTVSSRNKNVRRSTIGFAILFGLGLLCLLFMIKNSTPKTASASEAQTDEAQIELAIARLTGASSEMFNRMDQIVKKFYESSNVLQVQVNELVKNPFELELFLSDLRGKVDLQEGDIGVNSEMFKQQQVRQMSKDMQLKSIMKMPANKRSCCMIDDKILYEGDLIKGFKVTLISDNYVKLKWWDAEGNSESSSVESVRNSGLEIILKLSE